MRKNEENPGHSHLLIIGNGFDLQCGLHTTYADFFKDRFGLGELKEQDKISEFYNEVQVPKISRNEKIKDEDVNKMVKEILITSFNKILGPNNKAESYIQNKNYTKWDLLFLCEKILYEKVILNTDSKHMKDTINNWASVETFIFDIVTWIFKDANWKGRYGMPNSFKERFKKYILKGKENEYLTDFQTVVERCYSIIEFNNFDTEINKLAVNMLNDLNEFEAEFAQFIMKEIEQREGYKSNARRLIERILYPTGIANVWFTENASTTLDVLNFNYSLNSDDGQQIEKDFYDLAHLKINSWTNIHGVANKDPKFPKIIFGIDNRDIFEENGKDKKLDFNDPRIIFTKSFRLMDNHINDIRNHQFQNKVDVISFYGHSLGEADYSYFESIFDKYDIYHKNVKIEFYYYPGNSGTKEEEKKKAREFMEDVYKLLTRYGNTISADHGLNMVNRLMLEERLSVLPDIKL